ncbi:MAG: hypothetical protein CSA72_03430 [Rhodobacterales bacterium]|nr:MAG: hypothetical protein CSA72_03430 [Rhodobacterales bacterium]
MHNRANFFSAAKIGPQNGARKGTTNITLSLYCPPAGLWAKTHQVPAWTTAQDRDAESRLLKME